MKVGLLRWGKPLLLTFQRWIPMLRSYHAIIDSDGSVRLLEGVTLDGPRRALVTVLDEPVADAPNPSVLASESALSDWDREEEDAAWAHMQQEQ
jgi:hypothetical protein